MEDLLDDMAKKGLASCGSDWLVRMVQQRKGTIALAESALLMYDRIDRYLASVTFSN